MKIRSYLQQDLEAITETINTFKQENDKKKLHFPAKYVDINNYKKNYLGITDVVIAVENNEVSGFAVGHKGENHENYWLEIIYIRPEHRNKDLAPKIIEKLEEQAFYKGYKRIQSRVSKDNYHSIKLHEKLRFNKGKFSPPNSKDNDNFYLMTRKIQ